MLFTAGAAEFLSGAIMFDETMRQKSSTGVPLAQYCRARAFFLASRSILGRNP